LLPSEWQRFNNIRLEHLLSFDFQIAFGRKGIRIEFLMMMKVEVIVLHIEIDLKNCWRKKSKNTICSLKFY
jgi:hypothetical protein